MPLCCLGRVQTYDPPTMTSSSTGITSGTGPGLWSFLDHDFAEVTEGCWMGSQKHVPMTCPGTCEGSSFCAPLCPSWLQISLSAQHTMSVRGMSHVVKHTGEWGLDGTEPVEWLLFVGAGSLSCSHSGSMSTGSQSIHSSWDEGMFLRHLGSVLNIRDLSMHIFSKFWRPGFKRVSYFMVFFLLISKFSFSVGDQGQVLSHARQELYHWDTSPGTTAISRALRRPTAFAIVVFVLWKQNEIPLMQFLSWALPLQFNHLNGFQQYWQLGLMAGIAQ